MPVRKGLKGIGGVSPNAIYKVKVKGLCSPLRSLTSSYSFYYSLWKSQCDGSRSQSYLKILKSENTNVLKVSSKGIRPQCPTPGTSIAQKDGKGTLAHGGKEGVDPGFQQRRTQRGGTGHNDGDRLKLHQGQGGPRHRADPIT